MALDLISQEGMGLALIPSETVEKGEVLVYLSLRSGQGQGGPSWQRADCMEKRREAIWQTRSH